MSKQKQREKGHGDFPWIVVPAMIVFWIVVFFGCHWIIFS